MIGYKIVRLPDYGSILAQPPYTVYYHIGTTVIAPPNTLGLMIFDTLDNALNFIIGTCTFNKERTMLRVSYRKAHASIPQRICNSTDSFALDKFYSDEFPGMPPPTGTVLCGKLIVIRKEIIHDQNRL